MGSFVSRTGPASRNQPEGNTPIATQATSWLILGIALGAILRAPHAGQVQEPSPAANPAAAPAAIPAAAPAAIPAAAPAAIPAEARDGEGLQDADDSDFDSDIGAETAVEMVDAIGHDQAAFVIKAPSPGENPAAAPAAIPAAAPAAIPAAAPAAIPAEARDGEGLQDADDSDFDSDIGAETAVEMADAIGHDQAAFVIKAGIKCACRSPDHTIRKDEDHLAIGCMKDENAVEKKWRFHVGDIHCLLGKLKDEEPGKRYYQCPWELPGGATGKRERCNGVICGDLLRKVARLVHSPIHL